MNTYTTNQLLRVAKRFHNTKRTYLFVNPLQAKHLCVSPKESLNMMKTLGSILAEKYPKTKLVVGFAETATAIGAAVAECFSPDCVYIHTTRENVGDVSQWIYFLEEHSHAAEQSLAEDGLARWIDATETVIFVDDEISTGKTLVNMIEQLQKQYPQLKEKQTVAASLLNRVSEENTRKLAAAGIISEYLVKLPELDYSREVSPITIHEAPPAPVKPLSLDCRQLPCDCFADPRKGLPIRSYTHNCEAVAEAFLSRYAHKLPLDASVLVLGTEECMYPALKIGEALEAVGITRVRCHATTRSPIGICEDGGYPINSGYKLRSFYDSNRTTYVYNLAEYHTVIVVSDTSLPDLGALENLAGALPGNRIPQLFYIHGGKTVWCSRD